MMSPQDSIRRLLFYAKRNGFRGTLRRLSVSLKRLKAGDHFVLFACNLNSFKPTLIDALTGSGVERIPKLSDLASKDLCQIANLWNPEIARRQMEERFHHDATLWMLKIHGKLAAYGWTLVGKTMEPHFFPLRSNDIHLFDFFVLPEFRGKKINVVLMNHILAALASEQDGRAFIEAAQWNSAQLSSLKRSPFQLIGRARKASICGKAQVVWNEEGIKQFVGFPP